MSHGTQLSSSGFSHSHIFSVLVVSFHATTRTREKGQRNGDRRPQPASRTHRKATCIGSCLRETAGSGGEYNLKSSQMRSMNDIG